MTKKEFLLKFIKEKQKLIEAYTSVEYVNDADIKEIEDMDNLTIDKIVNDLEIINDSTMCPWCLLKDENDLDCSYCNYGKRHGECNDEYSTYSSITRRLGSSIAHVFRDYLEKILEERECTL